MCKWWACLCARGTNEAAFEGGIGGAVVLSEPIIGSSSYSYLAEVRSKAAGAAGAAGAGARAYLRERKWFDIDVLTLRVVYSLGVAVVVVEGRRERARRPWQ